MEGRCAVETLTDLGHSAVSLSAKVKSCFGTHLFLCTGSEDIYVFGFQDRKVTAVIQCPGSVSDLVVSPDQQLFVSCWSGVYCVALRSLLSRMTDSCPGVPHLEITTEHLVVEEEGVSSLLLVGSSLLNLSHRGTFWSLAVHKKSASGRYELLSSFKLLLVTDVVHDGAKQNKGRRTVLICVHSYDTTPPSAEATQTDGHFHLSSGLFKLLFGVDAALAKSPVIVCGLPDGRLCFIPLRIPGSQLRVLHSLEQPVVFVGASVAMETGSGATRGLVAAGEQGKVALIMAAEGGPGAGGLRAAVTEGCVPGPVVCASMGEGRLYYSTGADLLALQLPEASAQGAEQQRDGDTQIKTPAALQSPASLNVCRILALATGEQTAGRAQLLALSCSGQLRRITLPAAAEEGGSSNLAPTQAGSSVRDLLSAIGDVCERASLLKSTIRSKNQSLRRLNQALSVSFLLAGGGAEEERLIRCRAVASWSRSLQEDTLNLACVLDNGSPYLLERGWTLSITAFPVSGGRSTNFSFALRNLRPGEQLEVSLPLAAAGDTSYPVTISCSLIFSLSGFLGEEEAEEELPGVQRCFSLPLNTLTVDWLHTLRVSTPADSHIDNTDAIQAFLNSHQRGSTGREGSAAEEVQHRASVTVSSQLLRDKLTLENADLDSKSACVSLLRWLLSEGPGGVRAGDEHTLMGSEVHARAPDGHAVKLTAKEVSVAEDGRLGKGQESLATVEVRVESSSLAAVCGLHHAILRRVETLLQRAPEKAATTATLQSLCLRGALRQAERMLQQIQQTQISQGGGVSTGQTTRTLLSVYQELRENPLPLL